MFVERLVGVILAQLSCPLSDVMFCLHSRITNPSLYKHWFNVDKIFLWRFEIGIKTSLLLNIVLEKSVFPGVTKMAPRILVKNHLADKAVTLLYGHRKQ
jgi:hypothetical protein